MDDEFYRNPDDESRRRKEVKRVTE